MSENRPLYPILPAPWTVKFTRRSDGMISGATYQDGDGQRVPLLDVRELPEARTSPWLDSMGLEVKAPGARKRPRGQPRKAHAPERAPAPQAAPDSPLAGPEPIAAPAPAESLSEAISEPAHDHGAPTGIDSGERRSVERVIVGHVVHEFSTCSAPGCTNRVRVNGCRPRKTCSVVCRSARAAAVARQTNAARRGQRLKARALPVPAARPSAWRRAWGAIVMIATWWRS